MPRKKLNIAFLLDQPFVEQISKYLVLSFSSNGYLARFFLATFNWSSRYSSHPVSGLHKLRYPGNRDISTWSKFGAHGEHGDVFLFSNLGAL